MGNQTSDVYMKEGLPPSPTHQQAAFTHELTEVVVSFAKSLFSLMIATSIKTKSLIHVFVRPQKLLPSQPVKPHCRASAGSRV